VLTNIWKSIEEVTKAMQDRNWKKYKEAAHSLKSQSGYVGACYVHYDCYFIQAAFLKNNELDMERRYQRLIEDSIALYAHFKEIALNTPDGQQYIQLNPDKDKDPVKDLKLAGGFELVASSGGEVQMLCIN
jgi:hypothetical protein